MLLRRPRNVKIDICSIGRYKALACNAGKHSEIVQTEFRALFMCVEFHVRNLFKNLSNWNSLPLKGSQNFMKSLQDTINWEYKEEATRKWRKIYREEFHNFYTLPKNDYVNQTNDYLTGKINN
jgi:hypothetical protein